MCNASLLTVITLSRLSVHASSMVYMNEYGDPERVTLSARRIFQCKEVQIFQKLLN